MSDWLLTDTIPAEENYQVEVGTDGNGSVIVTARSTWASLTPANANALAAAITAAATTASGQ